MIPARVFLPTAGIYETNDTVNVVLEMPGLDNDSVATALHPLKCRFRPIRTCFDTAAAMPSQRRPRHQGAAGMARAQEHSAHRSLYRRFKDFWRS
jgi:hypothetical protein